MDKPQKKLNVCRVTMNFVSYIYRLQVARVSVSEIDTQLDIAVNLGYMDGKQKDKLDESLTASYPLRLTVFRREK